MKTAVSVWSFQKLISKGELTHLSCLAKAKEYGFDAVEYIDLYVPEGKTEAEYAKEIRAEADRLSMEISTYSLSCDLLNGCGGNLEQELERLYRKIDIAEILGAKIVRHDITPHPPKGYVGYVNLLPRFVEASRALSDYAEKKGIRTCTENHGNFSQDSDRVVSLINATERENFGIQIDLGNFLCAGEDPAWAVSRTATYAFNVHLKDFLRKSGEIEQPEGFFMSRAGDYLRGTIAGHGVVPIRQCINALKRAGYDGYLTVEYEGFEDIDFAMKASIKFVKTLL